jgi:hypothetical protein
MVRDDGAGNLKMVLVYQPIQKPNLTVAEMIDANSGQALDWSGSVVKELPRAAQFKDTVGDASEKDIRWLGMLGMFREYGDAFHPSEKATVGSLVRSMLVMRSGVEQTAQMSDDQVLDQAKTLGWIKEDTKLSAPITRTGIARLMVRYLGLDYMAQVPGLYQVPYKDLTKAASAVQGYASITHGLGIMLGDGSQSFRPQETVTRSQAAAILARTLRVRT